MSDLNQKSEEGYLSASEVSLWVKQEISDANRAHMLRVAELNEIARAYSEGKITPKEADRMHSRYYARWGDALPTASTGPGVTDEQILRSLDEAADRRKRAISAKHDSRGR